jgi:methylphosphotriester-DNA--protein-cysteine methyltransferase
VSKFHFARSFEAAYGETPMRYLTRRRIERSQDLLRQLAGARRAEGVHPGGLRLTGTDRG